MLIQKMRLFSYNRQKLGKSGDSSSQVLSDIVGVYSSHPTAPLALHARVSAFSGQEYDRLDEEKLAFRIPAMRESVYLLPRENVHRIMSATLPSPSDPYWQKRYSQKGRYIPADKYADWKKEILGLTSEPVTVAELKGQGQIPSESLKAVLNRIAFEGELLRIGAKNLRSNIIQYVSSKKWTDQKFIPVDPDEALKWLAGEYLRAFGPARVRDFQWWSGVSSGRVKKAIAALDTIELDNNYLLLRDDLSDFENIDINTKDSVDLLPQWDSYTMGYAPDGRKRFVSPEMQERLYGKLGATGGNALGAIMVNGLVQGTWNYKFEGNQMNIGVQMFEKPLPRLSNAILKEFEQIGVLLQATKQSIKSI